MGGSNQMPPFGVMGYAAVGQYGALGVPAAGNVPGGRLGSMTWSDKNDNYWLFGGNGVDAKDNDGYLNDLGEFNPSTNEWTWMGGSSIMTPMPANGGAEIGVYGTLGTPAAGNLPGGRYGSADWTNSSGNVWLFGGEGIDANGNAGYLNDLWRYQP